MSLQFIVGGCNCQPRQRIELRPCPVSEEIGKEELDQGERYMY